ncbi:MAG: HlyD family efflux transporter periplasmic adaptor subunit, partial [Candidatus Moranbacteria bacterium]|nr:HlyD family efflux transporter periplasmic adaptor subunit [Candidatus Moranbacteria bacterium]
SVWPRSLAWISGENMTTSEGSFIVEYLKGHQSIRVSSGRIVSLEQTELSFLFSGTVAAVLTTEGQHFDESDQPLLQLDTTEWELERKRAQAEYDAEQAIVSKLQQGARFEELLIVQQKKQSLGSALKGSKNEVIDAITQAFVQADDAVRGKTDVIFTNPESDPQLSFSPSDSALEAQIESDRSSLKQTLQNWESDVNKMKSSGDTSKYLDGARNKLKTTREYLDAVAAAVNALVAGSLTQETIDAWKEAVATARTNVATAAVSLGGAESSYKVANRDLAVAQSELDLKLAGTQRQDIEAALSAALAAKSQLDIIAEKLKQTTLRTPSRDLIVKKIFPKKGEYVEAGKPVVVVMNPTLKVELDIPEEKIAGVTPGSQVILRLNAYPYEDITGVVSEVLPQEIEKDGSIYFRAHATLDQLSDKIRTGMTGDVIVETTVERNILRIPKAAIHGEGGRRSVSVLVDSQYQERVIELGVEQDGLVEVLSGLQSGDQLMLGGH